MAKLVSLVTLLLPRRSVVTPGIIVLFAIATASGRNAGSMVIGCWSPPRNLDSDYFEFLVELGFTHTLYWRSPEIDVGQWRRDLDRAQKAGVQLIFDSWQPAAVPDKWLDAVLRTACTHSAFAGIYLPDEPGYRFPLESEARRPSMPHFQSTFEKMRDCGRGVLYQVDAVSAQEPWIEKFLSYSTTFGIDIYPYKEGIDWRRRVEQATRQAVRLAGARPVWMVLQAHGRVDWYEYATQHLNLKLEVEKDPRPPADVLFEMGKLALESGATGVWWWSFELYDWSNPTHREFIHQFGEVNRRLKNLKQF